MRRIMVAGNWKMNTHMDSATELARGVAVGAKDHTQAVDILVCPPFPYIAAAKAAVPGTDVMVGAQNCYFEKPGAFTGEVSVDMLKDLGCSHVILGHSERRHVLGETDETVNRKVLACMAGALPVVLCVGELLAERQSGRTEEVLDTQMSGGLAGVSAEQMRDVVIAYEPVWAIGTGQTATPEQAQAAHAHLRTWLKKQYTADVARSTRILYGGSVKPSNAHDLLSQPDVDGALVGGASLNADDFVAIIEAGANINKK